ncbi:unnamed protein product [Peniophora sp. CBMAI 1063]|nr:unnamed protein product [Peniophora sp. CBMAI 1063]
MSASTEPVAASAVDEPRDKKSSVPSAGDIASPPQASYVPRKRDFGFLPIPKRLRYDPARPTHFSQALNYLFAAATCFIVANLNYVDPLLIQLSLYFKVDYNRIARIPTLIQAGYGSGLLLICPLGDLVHRRMLLLTCITVSTSLTVGLCITKSVAVFEALCFLIGMSSVVPQIMVPLAADLAPTERRGTALSIVFAGLSLGVLMARVVSGVIAEFADWRSVFYMAIGLQGATLLSLWATVPDYPPKTKDLTYFDLMWSLVTILVTEPKVVQTALIQCTGSVYLTAFFVTLTFLLGDAPYHYSTLAIGLMSLVGIFGVCMAPLSGRVVDKVVPWWGAFYSTVALLGCMALYTGAAGLNIGAIVVFMVGVDLFRQLQVVCLTTAVLNIAGEMRARMNALIILSLFIGKVIGTSGGTAIFVAHGWRIMGVWMMGLVGLQFVFLFSRGPHAGRRTWLGWEGGLGYGDKRSKAESAEQTDAEKGAVGASEEKVAVDVKERPAEAPSHG